MLLAFADHATPSFGDGAAGGGVPYIHIHVMAVVILPYVLASLQPGRYCYHQVQIALRYSASRMKVSSSQLRTGRHTCIWVTNYMSSRGGGRSVDGWNHGDIGVGAHTLTPTKISYSVIRARISLQFVNHTLEPAQVAAPPCSMWAYRHPDEGFDIL